MKQFINGSQNDSIDRILRGSGKGGGKGGGGGGRNNNRGSRSNPNPNSPGMKTKMVCQTVVNNVTVIYNGRPKYNLTSSRVCRRIPGVGGAIIGGLVGFFAMVLCCAGSFYYYNTRIAYNGVAPADTVGRVSGCESMQHSLSATTCASMLQQGRQEYNTG